jgi:hypothetical protein
LSVTGVAAGVEGYQEDSDSETFTTQELVGWCYGADTEWGYSTVPEDEQTYPRLMALEDVAKALGDDKLLAAVKECLAPE